MIRCDVTRIIANYFIYASIISTSTRPDLFINIYPVSIRLSLTNSKKRKKKIKRNGKEEEEEQKGEKGMGQRVTLE